jgi:purine-nucleoside phosphorylase
MYRELAVDEYKKMMELPPDYKVEGFLSFGTYNVEKQVGLLKNVLDSLNIQYELNRLNGFLSNVFELKIDNKICWFTVVYGGPMLSEYLHLACLLGTKKNIHLGSCGGLDPEGNSLDLIMPTYSYGDESSTRMYQRDIKDNKHYPDKYLSSQIKNLVGPNFSIHEGPIITVQAMMAETLTDVKNWSEEGYVGVEMETAIVFAISNHFKIPSSAIFNVSDNLIRGQRVGDDQHANEKELRLKLAEELYRVAILVLSK